MFAERDARGEFRRSSGPGGWAISGVVLTRRGLRPRVEAGAREGSRGTRRERKRERNGLSGVWKEERIRLDGRGGDSDFRREFRS